MIKSELEKLITEYGDAIVNYRSQNSNKLKYCVCTLDFRTPYIQKKKKNKLKEPEGTLLVFCWDTDSFKMLKYAQVTSVTPLGAVLRNNINV